MVILPVYFWISSSFHMLAGGRDVEKVGLRVLQKPREEHRQNGALMIIAVCFCLLISKLDKKHWDVYIDVMPNGKKFPNPWIVVLFRLRFSNCRWQSVTVTNSMHQPLWICSHLALSYVLGNLIISWGVSRGVNRVIGHIEPIWSLKPHSSMIKKIIIIIKNNNAWISTLSMDKDYKLLPA